MLTNKYGMKLMQLINEIISNSHYENLSCGGNVMFELSVLTLPNSYVPLNISPCQILTQMPRQTSKMTLNDPCFLVFTSYESSSLLCGLDL